MTADSWFAVRITGMTSLIFSLKCALCNWADPQLTTFIVHGARVYPLGHYVHGFTAVLAVGVWVFLRRCERLTLKCLLPPVWVMLVVFAVTWINFHPPFPNFGYMMFMAQIACVGLLATWVRCADTGGLPREVSAAREAKIEWIKERISLWRVLTVSGTLGFFWMIIPWMNAYEREAIALATEEGERRVIMDVFRIQMWAMFCFMVFGPIYEAIARTIRMRDMFLDVHEAGIERSRPIESEHGKP